MGVHRPDAAVAEPARDRRVVPGTDAAQYPDRVVALVEPHAPDLDAFIEERPGRAKGALAPPFLQGLVAADQHEATRHGRLSSCFRIDQCYDERAHGSLRPGGRPRTRRPIGLPGWKSGGTRIYPGARARAL